MKPVAYIGADAFEVISGGETICQTLTPNRVLDTDVALTHVPDGFALVPAELIKEARRIVARAYVDGNSASRRHYDCMTALERLVEWGNGDECILPGQPNTPLIAAARGKSCPSK